MSRENVTIRQLQQGGFQRWDQYVSTAPNATFFHRAGWKTVLERAFKHRPYFLYAQQRGKIVGVLPLAQVRSRLFGNNLASIPFCVYGGVVADNHFVEQQLLHHACELARLLKVDALELRNLNRREENWPTKDLYVTFRKDLDTDHEVNMKAIPGKQRAMVRKGIAEGLASEMDEGVDRVYAVYAESLRNLGTPVFGKKYFRVLREVFAEDSDVMMVTHEGRDVAGVLNFYFRDQVLPYYGGSIAAARSLRGVNHFMYWELMRRSVDRGYKVFDFGRSKRDTGAYEFKKNFGFEPEPLHYQYHLVRAQQIPELNPNNPKYQRMIKTWKKMPLFMSNGIGPLVAKYLG